MPIHRPTVLALAALAFAPSARAEALAPVVVSATRSAQSAVTVPASITIIGEEEIAASGARSLTEVLEGRGGVVVSDLFGDGSRSTVSMRGFDPAGAASNVLILVDGRRLNNADLGGPDLASVALKDVAQVEIIQGSAGTLFGDQAVGGVINIITRTPRAFHADAEVGAGSDGQRLVRGSLGERFDNGLAVRLSAEHREADNYRDHNRREYGNAFARADYAFADGSVFVEWQHDEETLELPGYLTAAERDEERTQAVRRDDNDATRDASRLGTRLFLGPEWQLEAELAYRDEDIEGSFSGIDFTQDRRHLALLPRLVGALPFGERDLLLTVGADLDDVDYRLDSAFGTTAADQRTRALYAQAVIPWGERTTVTAGARHARYDAAIDDSFSFPDGVDLDDRVTVAELGLSYQATPEWRLFARRDGNFRFALVDENTFTPAGVVGLDTQTGVSWETGAEWQRGGHRAKAVAYRLDLEDEITFDPGATAFGGANVNLDETRRRGLILEGRWAAAPRLGVSGQYTYTDPRITGGPFDGEHIPFVADHVARLALDYSASPNWQWFGEAVYTGERYPDADYGNSQEKLSAYTVVNLSVGYTRGPWSARLRVNNVTDERYDGYAAYNQFTDTVGFYPAPERNALLSVGYSL